MRTINLCHGAGNGTTKACLMTASNMLIGKPQHRDDNECVCYLLRSFVITTNDSLPIPLLNKYYSPLVWEILGTRTDDKEVLKNRAVYMFEWANKNFKLYNIPREHGSINSLASKLHRANYHNNNYNRKIVLLYSLISEYLEDAQKYTRNIASYVSCIVPQEIAKIRISNNTNHMKNVKIAAIARRCAQLIRDVAAIGDKRPVETVMTYEELANSLAKV